MIQNDFRYICYVSTNKIQDQRIAWRMVYQIVHTAHEIYRHRMATFRQWELNHHKI